MQHLFEPNSLSCIVLLRCVLCEGQCEAGELCRREVDSWTNLSPPTGEGDDFLRVVVPFLEVRGMIKTSNGGVVNNM